MQGEALTGPRRDALSSPGPWLFRVRVQFRREYPKVQSGFPVPSARREVKNCARKKWLDGLDGECGESLFDLALDHVSFAEQQEQQKQAAYNLPEKQKRGFARQREVAE